ncbi:short chain dehydrogenase [Candidatus Rhabdochlamydia oedothoracis]|uniref:Short chain dehydrogenase n=1 Tax=Candidatus Rhabdochlamydia oedothoracis TaxID=2720720 RepID=A0ABX8V1S6_9BACT|nr:MULTISPECIES: SDR family oxidoreductase [Rhabdochlamydia]KAG6559574.1 putative oxidoreductase [Candidatus Rhabdochlamydia sp. W815]QYF48811.1 short chain dehydrogenase [Candidatus Rhabdochlamydia oedothoracis]
MDNIALVTGASSGIGKAISRELVNRGWTVIGVARSEDKLIEIQNELSSSFIPIICDVSRKENIGETSKQILERKLYPSLFFLNAGIAGEAVIENPNGFNLKIHENIMQVNYFGVLAWVEFWEKPSRENGGTKFIATSSINAIFAPLAGSAYSASKAAIAKAFESLSLTYYGTNLRFSVVYPGPVDTAGLKTPRKLPFTWTAEKMGKCMVNFALSNKSSCEPFFFYKIATRLLRALPAKYTMKLLGQV